jgi:polar amino acid transport system permease protein
MQPRRNSLAGTALAALATVAVAAFLLRGLFEFALHRYEWNWAGAWEYRGQFLRGWLVTLAIAAGAMVVSLVVGLLLMAGRRAPLAPLRSFCWLVVELVRGTPLLVQLLIGYYVVAQWLRIGEPLVVGMLLLGLFEGAYLAEIFRGAVESIGASQREAARAVGLDTWQTYRLVIMPQALRRALPGTTGQLVSLVKDSSLLSVIGIEELVQKVRIMNAAAYTALEGYIPLALAYLAVTLPLSRLAGALERRFHHET